MPLPTQSVYRIAADGGRTLVRTLPHASMVYGAADVSPDGTRVAYTTADPATGQPNGLHVLRLADGQDQVIAPAGFAPRWSADGARVAFLAPPYDVAFISGTLAIVQADGTQPVALDGVQYYPGLAWSPDDAYLLARAADARTGLNGILRAIRLRDGVGVALQLFDSEHGRGSPGYVQPDWH